MVVAIAAISITVFVLRPHKPILAFYRIPDNIEKIITDIATNPKYAGKEIYKIQHLDDSTSLASQITSKSKIDLLFTYDGQSARAISQYALAPSEQIRQRMPTTIRRVGKTNNKTYGVPLLLDFFEVAYNKKMFKQAGLSEPKNLSELKTDAKLLKTHTITPIICAGGQDTDLLMLVGALTESLSGIKGWEETITAMQKGSDFSTLIHNTPLGITLQEFIQWKKEGLIYPEWYRMKNKEIEAFMENDYTALVFMPLSTHRTIPQKTIEKFTIIAMPSNLTKQNRAFTVPVLEGILIDKKKPNKKAQNFLYTLTEASTQKELGIKTGLVPVSSTAETQDIQASDIRLWAAASYEPLPDIAQAAYSEPQKYAEFAQIIRTFLEADGIGFN
ncbi:MAG: extracellular solute-binding protein [Treponema sp.]|nr:extracellular solute-binding protein [Treponema sp.]